MIGGVDVIFRTRLSPAAALEPAVRAVVRRWPAAVFEDGMTEELFDRLATLPFGRLREVLVYRDRAAYDNWLRLGADPRTADTMVHLLAYKYGRLTAVVDDDTNAESRVLLDAIEERLNARSSLPRFTPPAKPARGAA